MADVNFCLAAVPWPYDGRVPAADSDMTTTKTVVTLRDEKNEHESTDDVASEQTPL